MIVAAMVLLGVGGGFAVLIAEARKRWLFERVYAQLVATRDPGAYDLATVFSETRHGCWCSRCTIARLVQQAERFNAEKRQRVRELQWQAASIRTAIRKAQGRRRRR